MSRALFLHAVFKKSGIEYEVPRRTKETATTKANAPSYRGPAFLWSSLSRKMFFWEQLFFEDRKRERENEK